MKDNNNLSKGLFLGLLAGGTLGAILALLYAPKPGKELRQDIKVKKDELMSETEKQINIAKEKAKVIINDGKKKSDEIINIAKEKAGKIIEDADVLYQNTKEKTADVVKSTKETLQSEAQRVKTAAKAGVEAYNESKNQPA